MRETLKYGLERRRMSLLINEMIAFVSWVYDVSKSMNGVVSIATGCGDAASTMQFCNWRLCPQNVHEKTASSLDFYILFLIGVVCVREKDPDTHLLNVTVFCSKLRTTCAMYMISVLVVSGGFRVLSLLKLYVTMGYSDVWSISCDCYKILAKLRFKWTSLTLKSNVCIAPART